jgi:hypothetical protein
MNFWATSESSKDVSQEYFSNLEREGAINALIRAINMHLQKVETGDWKQWCVIFMISSEEFKAAMGMRETRRLTRKDMTLDFRVFVPYEPSKTADFDRCVDLLVPPLLSTLPYFSKAGIPEEAQKKIREIVLTSAEEAKASRCSKH